MSGVLGGYTQWESGCRQRKTEILKHSCGTLTNSINCLFLLLLELLFPSAQWLFFGKLLFHHHVIAAGCWIWIKLQHSMRATPSQSAQPPSISHTSSVVYGNKRGRYNGLGCCDNVGRMEPIDTHMLCNVLCECVCLQYVHSCLCAWHAFVHRNYSVSFLTSLSSFSCLWEK